ncbi:MAG: KH domain-containing protein [Terriglobales bacterium]
MFLGLVLAAPVLTAQTVPDQTVSPPAATTTTPARDAAKVVKQQMVLPPMPIGPLSQMPMDEIPPMAAKVKFQGGLLEISAQNSTLGEILRDVRKLTGASIDFPPASSGMNERVVTHIGPGAPRDVLDVLLNGSSFNYVMVGSTSDPGAVSSVILSAKPSAAGETAANVRQPGQPMPANIPPHPFPGSPFDKSGPHIGMPGSAQAPAADAQDSSDDQEAAADDTADDQSQSVQPQPDTNDAETQGQAQQQPEAGQPNAGPKTPEQILELLRRQQQPGGMVPPQQQPPQPPPQQQ